MSRKSQETIGPSVDIPATTESSAVRHERLQESFAPTGNLVQRLWSIRGAYAWSTNLVLSSFSQYDTASENVVTNTRVRWTIRPGNDLFIV